MPVSVSSCRSSRVLPSAGEPAETVSLRTISSDSPTAAERTGWTSSPFSTIQTISIAQSAMVSVAIARCRRPRRREESSTRGAASGPSVRGGHPHPVKRYFRVAVWGVVVTEDRQRSLHLHTRGLHRDKDHGLLFVARRLRVGLAHENADPAPRISGTGDPPLPGVYDVLVSVTLDARPDIRSVRGGHVRLGHREARADPAIKQRLEPPFLLLGRTVAHQNLHVARVGGVAVEELRGDGASAHDLAKRCVLEVRQACPVRGAGQEEGPEPCSFSLPF